MKLHTAKCERYMYVLIMLRVLLAIVKSIVYANQWSINNYFYVFKQLVLLKLHNNMLLFNSMFASFLA